MGLQTGISCHFLALDYSPRDQVDKVVPISAEIMKDVLQPVSGKTITSR